MKNPPAVDLLQLREALEASWDKATAYKGAFAEGNPALGQCYPTSWVVQQFFPDTEIVEGEVWNGAALEKHFWNVRKVDDVLYHIDLTWQQFPAGSSVRSFRIRDRETLNDSQPTIDRCNLLRQRIVEFLDR